VASPTKYDLLAAEVIRGVGGADMMVSYVASVTHCATPMDPARSCRCSARRYFLDRNWDPLSLCTMHPATSTP
jgi:hypothetical protein